MGLVLPIETRHKTFFLHSLFYFLKGYQKGLVPSAFVSPAGSCFPALPSLCGMFDSSLHRSSYLSTGSRLLGTQATALPSLASIPSPLRFDGR